MKFLFTMSLLLSLVSCVARTPEGELVRFEYGETACSAQPVHSYVIERIDSETCRVTYYNHKRERNEENFFEMDVVECPATLLDEVAAILKAHKVWRYKSSYKPAFHVLDGYMWHYSADFKNGGASRHLSSSGSNAGPKDTAMREITALLKQTL